MLELQAKIVEEDDNKRNEILKTLGKLRKVEVLVIDDQIQVTMVGGENDTRTFADLMRVCEMCTCHMFRLRKR